MKKILTVAALLAAFCAVPATSNAEELNMSLPANGAEMDVTAATPTPPRFRRPPMRRDRFVCTARNIAGRSFRAYRNFRSPRGWVQSQALRMCRNRSTFILGRTCRVVGCSRF